MLALVASVVSDHRRVTDFFHLQLTKLVFCRFAQSDINSISCKLCDAVTVTLVTPIGGRVTGRAARVV